MSIPGDRFSKTFYPFLNTEADLASPNLEDLGFSVMEKARESADVKLRFFEHSQAQIVALSARIAAAFRAGGKMLVCGNGGSSTDAQHVAVEFMHPITVGRVALPVLCLSNDMATVTALANDVSFAHIFSRQVEVLGREGDVLLGISTSGNSENLIHAFEVARRRKMLTVAYAGGDGGRMREMAGEDALHFCLTAPTASVHRVQETHVTLYHIMWDLVHTLLQTGERRTTA